MCNRLAKKIDVLFLFNYILDKKELEFVQQKQASIQWDTPRVCTRKSWYLNWEHVYHNRPK